MRDEQNDYTSGQAAPKKGEVSPGKRTTEKERYAAYDKEKNTPVRIPCTLHFIYPAYPVSPRRSEAFWNTRSIMAFFVFSLDKLANIA